VEWVEITGKSVDEAKELALDELGVATDDAEFEVLEEPKAGLFGRVRGEARVRARVRPTSPRPKTERGRSRKPRGKGTKAGSTSGDSDSAPSRGSDEGGSEEETDRSGGSAASPGRKAQGGRSGGASNRGGGRSNDRTSNSDQTEGDRAVVTLDEQTEVASDFLAGLVESFGVDDAEIAVERVDEDNVEIRVTGSELGLLIGPKGQTLAAVQDLTRTSVQRYFPGQLEGRIHVDVSGYRQRRREALADFTKKVAEQALDAGESKRLEPMSPADRKVVHDTANEIDGITTESEGEEPRRRVVILLDD
jgi:spoIIIJ-associated protein